ncbi:MAG: glycosyltransferase family 2 protein [Candidatus Sericytochromatia bacterium]|nr:glycosyltransferase family 2 protein [Candidatus Sericytochromatia bacterium]
MIKLSACLIVKNEAHNLPRCLQSLKGLADEIHVLDTGSTDKSIAIAESFSCHVSQTVWTNHFAQVRNQVIKNAQGNWVLSIDADEWLTPTASKALQKFLEQAAPAFYALRWQQSSEQTVSQKTVLFPNHRGIVYLGRVHEIPWDPSGQTPGPFLTDITLSHAPEHSPLGSEKVARYRQLLALELQHPNELERFHALRHWGQSELILHQDQQARETLTAAWQLVPELPAPAKVWGTAVLESLLFLACETRDTDAYHHWLRCYAQSYPQHPRLKILPDTIPVNNTVTER